VISVATLRLRVIGCSPAWPNAGEASSCYLVEAGETRLLLDCGWGAIGSLLARDPRPVDAIVLSHLHYDHVADLVPLAFARQIGSLGHWPEPALHVPEGGPDRLGLLAEVGGASPTFLEDAFDLREYDPEAVLQVGRMAVRFAEVRHPGRAWAIRVEADGRALCFSGDTAPTPALPALARGADVLLCEAASADAPRSSDIHLNGADAGTAAAEAGVTRLVLTHVDAGRREATVEAARRTFGGPVEAAVPGLEVEV
jgi:ribonuclease BN (tRNA processing enzyme)